MNTAQLKQVETTYLARFSNPIQPDTLDFAKSLLSIKHIEDAENRGDLTGKEADVLCSVINDSSSDMLAQHEQVSG